jgi:hypothetical protein
MRRCTGAVYSISSNSHDEPGQAVDRRALLCPLVREPGVWQSNILHSAVVGLIVRIAVILSRVVVFLIMSRRIPNLYLFRQGTHVHHLN